MAYMLVAWTIIKSFVLVHLVALCAVLFLFYLFRLMPHYRSESECNGRERSFFTDTLALPISPTETTRGTALTWRPEEDGRMVHCTWLLPFCVCKHCTTLQTSLVIMWILCKHGHFNHECGTCNALRICFLVGSYLHMFQHLPIRTALLPRYGTKYFTTIRGPKSGIFVPSRARILRVTMYVNCIVRVH